ncbi:EF-hand domain-containing protein [Streptomyces sp. NPDC058613]|uniref:EF-hand domain-containing protein n=1 Tax=Streptomyces sp. NPDC058613 TaxID=3346556 RepID=UPI003656F517
MIDSLTRGKLRRRFELFDENKDGLVSKADYDRLADRLAVAADSGPDSELARKLRREYDQGWQRMCEELGCEAGASMNEEDFVATWHAVQQRYGFTTSIQPIVDTVITSMDRDGNGAVDVGEFTRWIGAYGVDPASARAAFDRLDRNGDERIGRAELTRAFKEYFLGTDENAPGNWIYGPFHDASARAR